jgi:hypothetical protein
LLGDYAAVGEGVVVEVTAGGDAEVHLPAPRCGEIEGRVFAGGVPVPEAIVFALKSGEKPSEYGKPESPDAFRFCPHCRTDAAGRFRFLVSVDGTFELRARHRDGAAWCAPVTARASPGAAIHCDIRLNAAAIRGSFDPGSIPLADREFLMAQLYRLQDASEDPFDTPYMLSPSLASEAKQAPVGKTGTFAFECLPAGGYVLRLVTRMHCILIQRVLHTVGDEVLDLGKLEVPKCVVPQLGCGLSAEFGVWVRQAVEGSESVFLYAAHRGPDGVFVWGQLVPGHYRLQACQRETFDIPDAPAEAVGQPVDVEVHADGTCTPAIVWPGGVAK